MSNPGKMVGGADAFICDVIKNNGDGTWDVDPRIVEIDGTDHPTIKVNAVGGIKAQVGDVVLVETVRNNLDDKKISRFYPASETNGRIVGVAEPVLQYVFKGDYKFEGDVTIQGNLEVTENVQVGGNVSVTGNTTISGTLRVSMDLTAENDLIVEKNLNVTEDLTVDGAADVGSLKVGGIDWLLHTHSGVVAGGASTGPGSQ